MSYLPKRIQTTAMDLILGAVGAFFLLLIIFATARRQDVQAGTGLPSGLLIATLGEEYQDFRFGQEIGYFVGLYEDGKLVEVWYSDEPVNSDPSESQGAQTDKRLHISESANGLKGKMSLLPDMAKEDRDKLVVGFWLRELPPEMKDLPATFNDTGIPITIFWNKEQMSVTLKPGNLYKVCQPSLGNEISNVPLQQLPEPEIPTIDHTPDRFLDINDKWMFSTWQKQDAENALVQKVGSVCGKETGVDSYPLYITGIATLLHDREKQPSSLRAATECLTKEDLGQMTQIHVGTRAVVCVTKDGSIRYKTIDYPLLAENYKYGGWDKVYVSTSAQPDQWQILSKEYVQELKNKCVGCEGWSDETFVWALAQTIAEPLPDTNTKETPLPIRYHPLLKDMLVPKTN